MTDTTQPQALYRLDLPAFLAWTSEYREEDYRITVAECPVDELFDSAGRLIQSTHQLFPSRVAALSQGILMLTLDFEEAYRINEQRRGAIEVAKGELEGLLHCPG
jgi:hypothetical protein